jgi:hypothetical protein
MRRAGKTGDQRDGNGEDQRTGRGDDQNGNRPDRVAGDPPRGEGDGNGDREKAQRSAVGQS